MAKDYEMVTVNNYVKALDEKETAKVASVEEYLNQLQRNALRT